jgi:hypothetical protein
VEQTLELGATKSCEVGFEDIYATPVSGQSRDTDSWSSHARFSVRILKLQPTSILPVASWQPQLLSVGKLLVIAETPISA